jgi:chromosome segregation ATPase
MITDQDINNLIVKLSAVLATKQDIKELDQRITKLENSVNSLTTAVDNLTSSVNKLTGEYQIINHRIDKHEKWIQMMAKKLGIDLEY